MYFPELHSWNVNIAQARLIQRDLSERIELSQLPVPVKLLAGTDLSYSRKSQRMFAAIVVLRLLDFSEVERVVEVGETQFPYIPGLLSFREAPLLLNAFKKLKTIPDVILVDGQGIAHPRKMGIATHLGIWLGIPTIGCAKTKLVGSFSVLSNLRSAITSLIYKGETIGAVVRTRADVKPVFISPGYRITLQESIDLVLISTPRYRLPEPIRKAHGLANQTRKEYESHSISKSYGSSIL